MFGFVTTHHRDTNATGSKPAAAAWPPGTLVSTEDIYRENKGMAPILLLRKGYEVSPEELPRFIRNGARPHQFLFKPADHLEVRPIPHQFKEVRRQELLAEFGSGSTLPATPRQKQRILILEHDAKSLKRLIDCLFVCGVPLDRIHTVRLAEQLDWAIAKYRPQVLMVGYHLPNGQSSLELLAGFHSLYNVSKIIFTLEPNVVLSEWETQALKSVGYSPSIQFLEKPASRFTVNRLLAE